MLAKPTSHSMGDAFKRNVPVELSPEMEAFIDKGERNSSSRHNQRKKSNRQQKTPQVSREMVPFTTRVPKWIIDEIFDISVARRRSRAENASQQSVVIEALEAWLAKERQK